MPSPTNDDPPRAPACAQHRLRLAGAAPRAPRVRVRVGEAGPSAVRLDACSRAPGRRRARRRRAWAHVEAQPVADDRDLGPHVARPAHERRERGVDGEALEDVVQHLGPGGRAACASARRSRPAARRAPRRSRRPARASRLRRSARTPRCPRPWGRRCRRSRRGAGPASARHVPPAPQLGRCANRTRYSVRIHTLNVHLTCGLTIHDVHSHGNGRSNTARERSLNCIQQHGEVTVAELSAARASRR